MRTYLTPVITGPVAAANGKEAAISFVVRFYNVPNCVLQELRNFSWRFREATALSLAFL